MKEVLLSGRKWQTAYVLNRKVPEVRILLLPQIGSLAQLDQSMTLRTSGSGVRISHESQLLPYGVTVSTSDSGSGGGGSNPSGATKQGALADLVYAQD